MVQEAAPVQIVSPGLKSQSKNKNIRGHHGNQSEGWTNCDVYSFGVHRRVRVYATPRVPECLFLRPNWPLPSPASECVPPLGTGGGGGATLAYRWGSGGNQFERRESQALCLLCGIHGMYNHTASYNIYCSTETGKLNTAQLRTLR
jgi:hypothetical protein